MGIKLGSQTAAKAYLGSQPVSSFIVNGTKAGLLTTGFNAGVNLNLFFGYGPVNPTVQDASYRLLTDSIVSDLVSFGVKVVRMPVRWEQIDPNRTGSFDSNTMSVLTASIAKLYAAGIGTIIDIHNSFIFCTNQANIQDSANYKYLGAGGTGGLTQAQFVTLWSGLSTAFKNNGGVVGYDLMNEPSAADTDSATSIARTKVAAAWQAAITAIRANGDNKEVLLNITDPDVDSGLYSISMDPARNIRWSHHDYPYGGGAGGDYDAGNAVALNIPVTTLVDKLKAKFEAFVAANGGKGNVGEYAVGLNGTYWTGKNGVLDKTLAYTQSKNWSTTFWTFDTDVTMADPNNLSHFDGTRMRPQRTVMAAYNGKTVPLTVALVAPTGTSYRSTTVSIVLDLRGIPGSAVTYTLSDNGAGGSFPNGATATVQAGDYNGWIAVPYITPNSDKTATISATNGSGFANPANASVVVLGAAPTAYTAPQLNGVNPAGSARFVNTAAYQGAFTSLASIVTGSPTLDSTGLNTNGAQCSLTTALKTALATTGPCTLMVEVTNFTGVASGERLVGSNPSGPGSMIYAGGNSVVAYTSTGTGGPQATNGGSAAAKTRVVLYWTGVKAKMCVGGGTVVTTDPTASGMRPNFLGWTGDTGDPGAFTGKFAAIAYWTGGSEPSDAAMQALAAGSTT